MYTQAIIESLEHICQFLCRVVQLDDGATFYRGRIGWLGKVHHPSEHIRVPRELSAVNTEADAFGYQDDIAVVEE